FFSGGIELAADFLIEDRHLGVAQFEHRAGDELARVVDDVSDSAAPIFAEDRKAQSVIVEDRGPPGLQGRRAMAVMAAPIRDGLRVEVGSVREIPHWLPA